MEDIDNRCALLRGKDCRADKREAMDVPVRSKTRRQTHRRVVDVAGKKEWRSPMKVKEFIRLDDDDYATVAINEYLIAAIFDGTILPSEAEVNIGGILNRKLMVALKDLDARLKEMIVKLEDDAMARRQVVELER